MLTKLPGAQLVIGVQLAAFVVVLKLPTAHAVHVRLVVALPSSEWAWPARQSVHATHAVAGFMSWSHVPLAHTCAVALPPAQWFPASQAAHTGGDVDPPVVFCTEPAGHSPSGTHLAWLFDDE